MEVIRELHLLPALEHPVVALGNFDGVHLGHRAILKAAIDRAHAVGGKAFALTFDPLPGQSAVTAACTADADDVGGQNRIAA